METSSNLCHRCGQCFATPSSRNRHLKKIHSEESPSTRRNVKCPICEDISMRNHDNLIRHIEDAHAIEIKNSMLNFSNTQDFEEWRKIHKTDVNYTCTKRDKNPNIKTLETIYYCCNRSNTKGYESQWTKRNPKKGGSIKIQGICPSRIVATCFLNGTVKVSFTETHVGHQKELRAEKLTQEEKLEISEKLSAGVSNERIIKDARRINGDQLERKNLLTRYDIKYLTRKFNINQCRDSNDMIATAMKVEEWNSSGKNNVFLFKKLGEKYDILGEGDFALVFMNGIMEKKLTDFSNIICMDGTHCTNTFRWELTTVLVKDDTNAGFRVAFLLSSRRDQVVQEVFLKNLQEKTGKVETSYFMSDDDPKYYNAWVKVMCSDKEASPPRRLLCTWHIVRNWDIQGRAKLKKEENKQSMKREMKKILQATKVAEFETLANHYLEFLESEEEYEFLKYLKKQYFKDQIRIEMWAHCYRLNAGINTNMALESLNKMLKRNKLKGETNIRVEKLLDTLDDLVDDKVWKRILLIERPTADSYQDKMISKAHREAENCKNRVEEVEFGKFRVKSSQSEKFYEVSYQEMCEWGCGSMFCLPCEICFHKYECECPEYAVKNTICKHVHMVAMYEQERSESVSEILEKTSNKEKKSEEINFYISERAQDNLDESTTIEEENFRHIQLDEIVNQAKKLPMESIQKLIELNQVFLAKLVDSDSMPRKRQKMELQTSIYPFYFI